jgi:hypothetical protein
MVLVACVVRVATFQPLEAIKWNGKSAEKSRDRQETCEPTLGSMCDELLGYQRYP